MYKVIFLVSLIFLVFLSPISLAQTAEPQHRIFDFVGQLTSNIWYSLKTFFYGIEQWFYEYVLHDTKKVEDMEKVIKKENAYNSYYNDKYYGCCKAASCYINPDIPCVTLCVSCEQSKEDLDKHFR